MPDPTPSITIPLADATALSQGNWWGEMPILQEIEAALGQAVAEVQNTGQPLTISIVINSQ